MCGSRTTEPVIRPVLQVKCTWRQSEKYEIIKKTCQKWMCVVSCSFVEPQGWTSPLSAFIKTSPLSCENSTYSHPVLETGLYITDPIWHFTTMNGLVPSRLQGLFVHWFRPYIDSEKIWMNRYNKVTWNQFRFSASIYKIQPILLETMLQ